MNVASALLVTASLLLGNISVAAAAPTSLRFVVFIVGSDTFISPNEQYCLMPANMPIRPGNVVRIIGPDGKEIGSEKLQDDISVFGPSTTQSPGDKCALIAIFSYVPIVGGYSIKITPEPAPSTQPKSTPVSIDWIVLADDGYIVSYDEQGNKVCDFEEGSPIREGMTVLSNPPPLPDSSAPDGLKIGHSSVDAVNNMESCGMGVTSRFPPAPKYELAVGTAKLSSDSSQPATPPGA